MNSDYTQNSKLYDDSYVYIYTLPRLKLNLLPSLFCLAGVRVLQWKAQPSPSVLTRVLAVLTTSCQIREVPHKHVIMGQYWADAASIGPVLARYWSIPACLQGARSQPK